MKTTLLTLCVAVTAFSSAQNIPNPSFDSIYIGGIDRIYNWVTSDGIMINNGGNNGDTIKPYAPNTHFVAQGLLYSEIVYSGQEMDTSKYSSWALKLKSYNQKYKTDSSNFQSFVVNGNHFYTNNKGYIDLSRCGIPFPYSPTKLKGVYKFADLTPIGLNGGRCVVLLKKWNPILHQSDTIAFADAVNPFGMTSSWKNFEVDLNYKSIQTPDSMVVAFYANTRPGQLSEFILDEISFEYGNIGLPKDQINNQLEIYPNPAQNTIRIKAFNFQPSTYVIFSAQGETVQSGEMESEISIKNLLNAWYVLEVKNDQGNTQRVKFEKVD